MIKCYEKYKQTKNIWYPEVPSHWLLSKVKYVAKTIAGGTPSTDKSEYWDKGDIPWLPSGKLQNCDITTAEKFITEEGLNNSSTKWIKSDTTLIALTGATCANIGFLRFQACANQSVVAIDEFPDKANSRFLFYMLISMRKQILTHQSGGAQAGINDGNVKNLFLVVPPLNEQLKIAQYLDHQTVIIDQLIQQKEKLIELLKEKRQSVINEAVTKGLDPNAKMKDSGIQGVEKIPNHWSVKRLKQIANAFGRIGYRGYTTADIVSQGEGAITISPSNLKGDYMTFEDSTYLSWEKYEESPEIQIFNNDVLMVKTGSTYGKVGFVHNLNEKATINPQLLVFKKITVSPEYLFNLLRTPLIKNQIETNVIGSTIPTMSQTKILNFKIVIPPDSEIEEILVYINNLMIKIDQLNSSILNQIEKLKEYRQSIISEAVTGKINVREWQPNKQELA